MTDQQTDYSAEQYQSEYGRYQQYTPPDVPADAPEAVRPVLKLSEPSPKPARPWPLAARLTVAVLIIGLAVGFAMSLITIHTVSGRANQASDQAAAEAASLASMGRQLKALQDKAPPPKVRLPGIYDHYGVCLVRTQDNATGDLANITLMTPVVQGGSYSCPQGNLVSVVPAP